MPVDPQGTRGQGAPAAEWPRWGQEAHTEPHHREGRSGRVGLAGTPTS